MIDGATLLQKVADLTTVEEGVAAAVDEIIVQETEIAKELKDALAANDQAALQAVADKLDSNTAALTTIKGKLADALLVNTVPPPAAAPTPTPTDAPV